MNRWEWMYIMEKFEYEHPGYLITSMNKQGYYIYISSIKFGDQYNIRYNLNDFCDELLENVYGNENEYLY